MTTTRRRVDDKTKTETVRKILAGEMTIQDAMLKFGIQSFQLHAWIGYVVIEQATTTRAVPNEIVRRMAEVSTAATHLSAPGGAISGLNAVPDARAIVEWYIRNVVLPGSVANPFTSG